MTDGEVINNWYDEVVNNWLDEHSQFILDTLKGLSYEATEPQRYREWFQKSYDATKKLVDVLILNRK